MIILWFQIVNDQGKAYQGSTATSLSITQGTNVDGFRKEVKGECPQILLSIDASQLKVYACKAPLLGKEEVQPWTLVDDRSLNDFGKTGQNPLLVAVPAAEAGHTSSKRIRLVDEFEPGSARFFSNVLVKHPLAIAPDVIFLSDALWGIEGNKDFLCNRDFVVGENLVRDFIAKPDIVVVAGSKGIGKSCLGLVMVSELLRNQCVVAYEFSNTKMLVISSKSVLDEFTTKKSIIGLFVTLEFQIVSEVGVYLFNSDSSELFRSLTLCHHDLVHVVDLGEQFEGRVEPDHPQIVISSPNSDKLKRLGEVALDSTFVIYPPWTLKEISRLNALLPENRQQTDAVLEAKFKLFGGIPRQIFVGETMNQAVERLSADLFDVPLEVWKAAFQSARYSAIPKSVPGAFVRITKGTVMSKQCNVRFASDYILQLVIRRHAQARRADLLSLLSALDSPRRMLAALQGFLLEEVMHQALLSPNPQTYLFKELDGTLEPPRDLTFPVLKLRKFSCLDMADIQAPMMENDYFQPTFPSFTSVGSFAIVRKNLLFPNGRGLCIVAIQATVSAEHPLKREALIGIEDKVEALHGKRLDLIVVFITNQGKGISKPQKLGEVDFAADEHFRQCVLYGMALDQAFVAGAE